MAPSVGLSFWVVSKIDSSGVWEEGSFALGGSCDALRVSFSNTDSEVFFFIRCKRIKQANCFFFHVNSLKSNNRQTMTDNVMTDKVVIVTGGASGIGQSIAERFGSEGAKVAVADIDVEAGKAVVEKFDGLFVQGDLSLRKDCKELVEKTLSRWGKVDILVNNAGFQNVDPVENFNEDTWDKMIALMLTAPFLLTRYAWPSMKAQKWGRIINIASIHGLIASPFKAAYISAKHGLLGLTRTTALEGGPYGITVNAICPAYVRTPLVEKQIADQARTRGLDEEEVISQVMLEPAAIKRLIEPAEIAALTRYLCRDEASYMTGSPVIIDGGWTAK